MYNFDCKLAKKNEEPRFFPGARPYIERHASNGHAPDRQKKKMLSIHHHASARKIQTFWRTAKHHSKAVRTLKKLVVDTSGQASIMLSERFKAMR